MSLDEKIQQLRKASGLSQEQLADQLGVSRQAVSKWELNDSVPDIDKIVLVSNLFSISTDELLKDIKSEGCHQEQSNGSPTASLKSIVKLNFANRQITIGMRVLIVGLIMLVLEFMFLPIYGWIHKTVVDGQGFYSDAINYAKVQPMPIVFTLTAIVILGGLSYMAIGYLSKKKNKTK